MKPMLILILLKNLLFICAFILIVMMVSCGKSDEKLSEEAQSSPQKDLSSTWTKSDGSRATNLEGLEFNETIYITIRFYGPFVYNETYYSNSFYDCYYNTIWDGDEVSGTVTMYPINGSASFCLDSLDEKSYLYEVKGAELSFYDYENNQYSYYY